MLSCFVIQGNVNAYVRVGGTSRDLLSRFSARDVQSQLPKWIRPCINYEDFEKLSGDLRDFFTYAERTVSCITNYVILL